MGTQRRDLSKRPTILDAAAFGRELVAWWRSIQPSWRDLGDGRPLLTQPMGEMDALMKPGKCGFFLVLLALVWWHDAGAQPGVAWFEATFDYIVADLVWALNELMRISDAADRPDGGVPGPSAKEVPRKRPRRADEAVAEAGASKRTRSRHG